MRISSINVMQPKNVNFIGNNPNAKYDAMGTMYQGLQYSNKKLNRQPVLSTTDSDKFMSSFREANDEDKKDICLEQFDGSYAFELLKDGEQRYEVLSSLKGDTPDVRTIAHQLLGDRNCRQLRPEETEFLIKDQKDDKRLVKDIINYEPVNIGLCSPEVKAIALDTAKGDDELTFKVKRSIANAENAKSRFSYLA